MKTEGLKCNRCGHDLDVEEVVDFEDKGESVVTNLRCPYCGAYFECMEVPESEKMEWDFYKDGEPTNGRFTEIDIMNSHCMNCGHSISMSGNFMLSDIDDTITDDDDDKMSFETNQCPYCGMMEVRWDNSENEKRDLDYWSEDNWLYDHLKDYDLGYLLHIWAEVNGYLEGDEKRKELGELLKKVNIYL